MKKKTIEHATNNIILDDKEMEVLIRQLVKEAGKKGFGVSKLNQAVATIWREEFSVEKKKLEPLTEEEEKFAEKVKKFLEHYGDDLVEFRNSIINKSGGFIIKKDDLKQKTYFLEEYYEILCSIYGVFQREERITQNQIVRFLKQHFDYKHNSISLKLKRLNEFFYYHLNFSSDTELPSYSEEYVDWKHCLDRNEEFDDFCSQFEFRNIQVNNVAIAIVWFIEKYF